MFAVVKEAEKEIKRGRRDGGGCDLWGLKIAKKTLMEFDEVFGCIVKGEREEEEVEEEVPKGVMELVEERIEAKKDKDWGRADKIRDIIAGMGWQVKDGKEGATVVKL